LKFNEKIMEEMTEKLTPPIIIIGMHRSGTSLLSRLLAESGVFQGYARDEHNESLFFQIINENIFRQEGLNWDQPQELHRILTDPDKRSLTAEYIVNLLEYYYGPDQDQGMEKNTFNFTSPWGWKDPRNTVTLPAWLQVFPDSKVIHIIRNGIDVAVSLWRRETSRRDDGADPHYSKRCQSLTGCFELWKNYVEIGRNSCLQSTSVIEVVYEDLVSKPEETIQSIFTFLKLADQSMPIGEISSIRPERRLAYLDDDRSKEFYQWAEKSRLLHELYGDMV